MQIPKIKPKQINEVKSYARPDFIKLELFQHINGLTSIIEDAQTKLKLLVNIRNNDKVTELLNTIKESAKLERANKKTGALVFEDGQNEIVLYSQGGALECKAQERKNHRLIKSAIIKDRALIEKNGELNNINDVENFLSDVLNKVDLPLLKLRLLLNKPENQAFIDKFRFASAYCRINKDKLSVYNQQIVNEIKYIYIDVFNNLLLFQTDATRTKVKNGYPGIGHSVRGTKMLDFENTESLKNGFTINKVKDHDIERLVIQIRQEDGSFKNIIINPDFTVHKTKALKGTCDTGKESVVYSNEELQSAEMKENLLNVREELKKYNDYILKQSVKLQEYKDKYTTTEVGRIGYPTLQLAQKVYNTYTECNNILGKLEYNKKLHFFDKFGIFCKAKNLSMTFKNILPKGEDLQISFPIQKNERYTKILVLKNENEIVKTLLMQGNKLLKFKARNRGRTLGNPNRVYYHTNDEIKNSGLKEYLDILARRFNFILESLKRNNY